MLNFITSYLDKLACALETEQLNHAGTVAEAPKTGRKGDRGKNKGKAKGGLCRQKHQKRVHLFAISVDVLPSPDLCYLPPVSPSEFPFHGVTRYGPMEIFNRDMISRCSTW